MPTDTLTPALRDAIVPDTVPADSLTADTLVAAKGMTLSQGIILEKPREMRSTPLGDRDSGISWIIGGLFLVFIIGCLRYRKNSRFFSLMLQNAMEVRERHNAFDDTLRETTFIWLLNVLWCGAGGILLYGLIYHPDLSARLTVPEVERMAICIGMAAAYTIFLTLAYSMAGNIFADGGKASLWVRGYLSTQGLEAIALFPIALISLCVPGMLGSMLIAGGIVFILAKLLFIYKGICIFFTEIASWVLFLYYLCSLEIVPIVLTYISASYLCTLV